MIWSGWEGDTNGQQDIYIAKMKNPWTIEGNRVKIAAPQFDWEKHGDLHDANNPPHVNVNEGPQALVHNDKLFIIFRPVVAGLISMRWVYLALPVSKIYSMLLTGRSIHNLSLNNQKSRACMRLGIIHFSNHQMGSRIGSCTMPIVHRGRDVADIVHRGPSCLPGIRQVCLYSESH